MNSGTQRLILRYLHEVLIFMNKIDIDKRSNLNEENPKLVVLPFDVILIQS